MFKSAGKVQYFEGELYKVWLLIDENIGKYYRSFIPQRINIPKYPVHISIYRGGPVPNMDKWGLHEGREIEFKYSGIVCNDEKYWWLEVECEELEAIRVELGLTPVHMLTRSPDGKARWHTTIANNK